MVTYNLDHLTQEPSQQAFGPIQDDEALFMFAIIRGMRLRRVLEIGGLSGYSAQNFLAAVCNPDNPDNPDNSSDSNSPVVYTVDVNPVPQLAPNHRVIIKNARDLTVEDVDGRPVDMVFFDCHDMVQMDVYRNFVDRGIITDDTVLALHDTNLHYPPYHLCGVYVESEDAYVHQPVERAMVNAFADLGYHVFNVHTTRDKHGPEFPFRHGVTVCQKHKRLVEAF